MGRAIAGITRGVWSFNESVYYNEALKFYDEVMYIDPLHVTYKLDRDSQSVSVYHEGYLLNDISMLYVFGYKTETLLLVKALQYCGCPTSDPYHLISRESLGKLSDLLGLVRSGAGTTAHILPSVDAAIPYLEALDDDAYPLLRKPIAGNKGRGIRKLQNREEAIKACTSHFRRSENVLLLERFMDYQHEYRVYVVDGLPVESYEKLKKEGSVVSNLHQGGSVVAVETGLKQRLFDYVTERLQDKLQTGIYGLDLAITGTGEIHIIEVNRTPGFNGLARLGLVNLPRYAHQVIYKRSRKPDPSEPDVNADHVILLLGDTNPGDSYQERREAEGRKNFLKEHGYDLGFEHFRDLLARSNFVVANLEVTVTEQRQSELDGTKPFVDRAAVDETKNLLKAEGIHAVSLANNHSNDYGERGLLDTIEAMQDCGIGHFGAGRTATEAMAAIHHHALVGDQDLDVVFVGGFEYRNSYTSWEYYATDDRPGVNLWTKSTAREQISAVRQQHPDSFIIACPHWGDNYSYASQRQKELGRVLCDSGADMIIGHGSHMLQEVEKYRGKWIIYSLGNFVFNSPGRFRKYEVLPYGLICQMNLYSKNGEIVGNLHLYPIRSDNKKTNHQPDFVSEEEFAAIIKFYMPVNKSEKGIQSLVKSGRDKWGFYLSLNFNSFKNKDGGVRPS